jgi:sec-independent protein translocase protein TatB
MFDIGFWELALIGVVALLVVGPDRLPALARTIGLWLGRIRRYVSTVRDDIEREIQADELRRILNKPDDLNPLKDMIEETTSTISDANKEIAGVKKQADELMSADAGRASGSVDTAGDDETGVAAPTPGSAATTVAEAVSARSEVPAQTPVETSDGAAEDAKSDEHRSR